MKPCDMEIFCTTAPCGFPCSPATDTECCSAQRTDWRPAIFINWSRNTKPDAGGCCMSDALVRYLIGTCLIFCAGALNYLGEPIFSLIPAAAGVYILGALLLEKIREVK